MELKAIYQIGVSLFCKEVHTYIFLKYKLPNENARIMIPHSVQEKRKMRLLSIPVSDHLRKFLIIYGIPPLCVISIRNIGSINMYE